MLWDKYYDQDNRAIEGVHVGYTGLSGPTAVLIGGVHGHETAGPEVMQRVMAGGIDLPKRGNLIVVSHANPEAIKKGERIHEANLNRWFRELTPEEIAKWSELPYEAWRAQELLPVLGIGKAALDLHEFSQEDGIPFIITAPRGFEIAKAIAEPSEVRPQGIGVVSYGWDRTEPGGTDGYLESKGIPGICLESGWRGAKDTNVMLGLNAVERFLAEQGLTEPIVQRTNHMPSFVEALGAYLKQTNDFKFAREFQSWDTVQSGDLIGTDGNNAIIAGGEGGFTVVPVEEQEEIALAQTEKQKYRIIFPNATDIVGAETNNVGIDRSLEEAMALYEAAIAA